MLQVLYTQYGLCGTGYVGRYQNSWTFIVYPFVRMYVCVYVVGRYQKFDGVPHKKYWVYSTIPVRTTVEAFQIVDLKISPSNLSFTDSSNPQPPRCSDNCESIRNVGT